MGLSILLKFQGKMMHNKGPRKLQSHPGEPRQGGEGRPVVPEQFWPDEPGPRRQLARFWGNILIRLQTGAGAALACMQGAAAACLRVRYSQAARRQHLCCASRRIFMVCIFICFPARSEEMDGASGGSWSLQFYWESCVPTNTAGFTRAVRDSEPPGCALEKNFSKNLSQPLSSSKNECPKMNSLTQTISPG